MLRKQSKMRKDDVDDCWRRWEGGKGKEEKELDKEEEDKEEKDEDEDEKEDEKEKEEEVGKGRKLLRVGEEQVGRVG
jgi:hypothetical protein